MCVTLWCVWPPDSSVHRILKARRLDGLPCPPPGDLPDPETETRSPALQADSMCLIWSIGRQVLYQLSPPGKPLQLLSFYYLIEYIVGFPGGLDGKEYTCNVGDWVLDPSSLRMNFLPEGSSLPCKRIYIEVIPPFPQTSQKIPKCPWK